MRETDLSRNLHTIIVANRIPTKTRTTGHRSEENDRKGMRETYITYNNSCVQNTKIKQGQLSIRTKKRQRSNERDITNIQ